MEIIDGHSHIASTRYTPPEFFEGIADNMVEQARLSPVSLSRSKFLDRIIAMYQDHDASAQIREMDKLGIKKSIVLLPDFTYTLKNGSLTIGEMYLEHKEILERNKGRFEVFAGIDPRWGADGFRLFTKGIEEYGFRGLKLYPPCGYRPDNKLLTPYYEYCHEHGLPVLFHIGATSPVLSFSEAMPIHVDEPARKYRNISFILAHGAVNYQEQCIQLCKYRPNVYLDLSGAQSKAGDRSENGELVRLFRSEINHKIIFGTDWPIISRTSMNRSMISMLAINDEKPYITSDETRLVLSGNMERILAKSNLTGAGRQGTRHNMFAENAM